MVNKKNDNQLIIFVKYPEAGRVKTRLGSQIGGVKAAKLYSEAARYITGKLGESDLYTTNIFYSPAEKRSDVKIWLDNPRASYFPQKGKDLGMKIKNAFRDIFSNGARNVIVVGSDCIDITTEDINRSFDRLLKNKAQVVIGPATDGGYYLLGLNALYECLFEAIEWSSEKVLSQTIEKLENKNLSYILLKELNDIDEIQDIDINSLRKIDSNLAEEIGSAITEIQGEIR